MERSGILPGATSPHTPRSQPCRCHPKIPIRSLKTCDKTSHRRRWRWRGEQCRREQDRPIVLAFALPYPKDHARAVNGRALPLAQCGHPQPCRRERGEDGTVLQMARDGQEGGDLGWTEKDRQRAGALVRRCQKARQHGCAREPRGGEAWSAQPPKPESAAGGSPDERAVALEATGISSPGALIVPPHPGQRASWCGLSCWPEGVIEDLRRRPRAYLREGRQG
jgi:hypothetical protein